MASSSPSDTTPPAITSRTDTVQDHAIEKKRARDRKSQKAMRERNKWNIQYLTQQVEVLTRTLDEETRAKSNLHVKLLAVEEENEQLRVQKAALQLRLLGDGQTSPDKPVALAPHEAIPLNISPTCKADEIVQTFVKDRWEAFAFQTTGRIELYTGKPDLSPMLNDQPNRNNDETSSIVSAIIRSYIEIDTLPRKVACYHLLSTFLQWEVLRTKASYIALPLWLRPVQVQLERPHAAWIDRIPWPKIRSYLIDHPEINFDDFVSAYSSSFNIKWDYNPDLVVISATNEERCIYINPIYEEHVRQLKNWTVEGAFRRKFPEMTEIIDSYGKLEKTGFPEDLLNPIIPRYAT